MKLIFDERALVDLDNIFAWISQDKPAAAKAVVERIFRSVEQLANFPHMGRAGHEEGTHEWVVPRLPYIVVYEIDAERDEIVIVGVFHGAQAR